MACPGIRKGGGGAKIEQLMSCGVPSIKTLYIIIVFFIYLLFVLSFSTFQKKNVLGGGGGLNHLANSSPLKKINNPSPPPNIHFHLIFLINSFPSLFKKKKIFFLGQHLANSSPLKKKLQFHKICTRAPPPPPPPTSIFIFLLFLSIFSPSLFKKNIFWGGGVYHLANSPPLKKLQLHKICTNPPPPPPNIHFYLPSFSFYLFSFTL